MSLLNQVFFDCSLCSLAYTHGLVFLFFVFSTYHVHIFFVSDFCNTINRIYIEGLEGRHILDSLQTGSGEGTHYTDADLSLGSELNVFGRMVLLCDCDEFTKSYYRDKYGIDHFEPVVIEEVLSSYYKFTIKHHFRPIETYFG